MASISSLTLAQLERAVAIKHQIEALEQELESLEVNGAATPAKRGRKKGWSKLIAASESVIAATDAAAEAPRKRRKLSRATKAKMAAAQQARWEKVRAQQAAA